MSAAGLANFEPEAAVELSRCGSSKNFVSRCGTAQYSRLSPCPWSSESTARRACRQLRVALYSCRIHSSEILGAARGDVHHSSPLSSYRLPTKPPVDLSLGRKSRLFPAAPGFGTNARPLLPSYTRQYNPAVARRSYRGRCDRGGCAASEKAVDRRVKS